jgi:hypothetical protein
MATNKSFVSPITPEKQSENKLTIKDIHKMSLITDEFYLDMEKKKLASCHDFKSQSDFNNLQREATNIKITLADWHKYLES